MHASSIPRPNRNTLIIQICTGTNIEYAIYTYNIIYMQYNIHTIKYTYNIIYIQINFQNPTMGPDAVDSHNLS